MRLGFGAREWVLTLVLAPLVAVACSGGPEARTTASSKPPTLPAAVPASAPAAPTSAQESSDPATPLPTKAPAAPAERVSGEEPVAERGAGRPTSLAAKAERDSTLTVIDEPDAGRSEGLVAAAQRARKEREQAPRRKIVITNDNLSEYATGHLTLANPAAPPTREGGEETAEEPGRGEDFWRQGALELRFKLRRAWDEARSLEEQVAGLSTRFYAEDDPYVRDSEIKPAWDRSLDRQRQAELEVKALRRELDEFLEDGRRAGALPGWLREGLEHEPEAMSEPSRDPKALDGFGRHQAVEPERMESPSRPPTH